MENQQKFCVVFFDGSKVGGVKFWFNRLWRENNGNLQGVKDGLEKRFHCRSILEEVDERGKNIFLTRNKSTRRIYPIRDGRIIKRAITAH